MTATTEPLRTSPASMARRPRLGFLGVGWIGFQRMQAVAESCWGEIAAIADPAEELLAKAHALAPGCAVGGTLEDLLRAGVDGVVIATPSALHAGQAEAALRAGAAVFCQKPLGRNAAECRRVVTAARAADRLLGVDLSYRFTEALRRIREMVRAGELGEVFALDLVFHNAYGPGKPWFYDRRLSGGGCVIDLGIHLVDAALWILETFVTGVESRLFHAGRPLAGQPERCEDFATARLELATGATANLACSWNLHAGRPAVIEARFYGTRGAAEMVNLEGSFTDFAAYRCAGATRELLCGPPDAWGGRAAVAWAQELALGGRFNPEAERIVEVAETLDAIYTRAGARVE